MGEMGEGGERWREAAGERESGGAADGEGSCSRGSGVKFPARSRQFSADIEGVPTTFLCLSYDDRLMVVVTQIGTLGTMLYARREQVGGAEGRGQMGGMEGSSVFNVSVLLGKRDEPLMAACARQLIETLSLQGVTRPLLLCLGLKDHSQKTLKAILQCVVSSRLWAQPSSA
ncbi:hypothetical protein CLOP_g2975 [Closterium sp. NIES-67]|nr:hypothetical protein CLOP_g21632 [Closterium sp. NIES-67]GJP72225.1 hypothetical protein CLOP_g2975 [Closterium sp. NIES-67]